MAACRILGCVFAQSADGSFRSFHLRTAEVPKDEADEKGYWLVFGSDGLCTFAIIAWLPDILTPS